MFFSCAIAATRFSESYDHHHHRDPEKRDEHQNQKWKKLQQLQPPTLRINIQKNSNENDDDDANNDDDGGGGGEVDHFGHFKFDSISSTSTEMAPANTNHSVQNNHNRLMRMKKTMKAFNQLNYQHPYVDPLNHHSDYLHHQNYYSENSKPNVFGGLPQPQILRKLKNQANQTNRSIRFPDGFIKEEEESSSMIPTDLLSSPSSSSSRCSPIMGPSISYLNHESKSKRSSSSSSSKDDQQSSSKHESVLNDYDEDLDRRLSFENDSKRRKFHHNRREQQLVDKIEQEQQHQEDHQFKRSGKRIYRFFFSNEISFIVELKKCFSRKS